MQLLHPGASFRTRDHSLDNKRRNLPTEGPEPNPLRQLQLWEAHPQREIKPALPQPQDLPALEPPAVPKSVPQVLMHLDVHIPDCRVLLRQLAVEVQRQPVRLGAPLEPPYPPSHDPR